jgi:hypothetical protein
MNWSKPPSSEFQRAIEIYLKHAYASALPQSLRDRVDKLHQTAAEQVYLSDVFERDDAAAPTRYSLRLGNRFYPHMKLVVERSPDGQTHLFRADTHDRHIRPAAGSRESKAFEELMSANQKLSEQIESDWAASGLPTFKTYLRDDLKRRATAPRPHA